MSIADYLLKGVGRHLALYEDRIPCLKRVKAGVIQAFLAQKIALGVQIQRAFGHRRACSDPPEHRLFAYLDDGLRALGCVVLDGSGFINRHEGFGDAQEHLGELLTLLRAERLDVHDQDAKIIDGSQHVFHLFLFRLPRRSIPTRHLVGDVLWHMLGDFRAVPVPVHPFGRDDQHGVDLTLVVQHGCIVDEHEALACSHLGEQGHLSVFVETLQIGGLM